MQPPVLSVSEFIGLLNQTLEFAYPVVTIEGEVSEYKLSQGKWVRFKLKDEETNINCFIPAFNLKVPVEDGMKIRATGNPKLLKWGEFSFNVTSVELAGEGALKRAFELLQAKLTEEGLFAEERKRVLPKIPKTIGLIASTESAAYKDFLKILDHRWGGVEVKVMHVQVQGVPAPEQIVEAISYFNELAEPVEVLVLTRGGGSLEDLQAFNNEAVVRAVAGSRTPTIVGVGHEVDTSLADLAADVRAATPTDAARIVVPDKAEMAVSLQTHKSQIDRCLRHLFEQLHSQLQHHNSRLERFIQLPRNRVIELENDLLQGLRTSEEQIRSYLEQVGHFHQNLLSAQAHILQTQIERYNGLVRSLKNLDPRKVLKRGYAIARKQGKVIQSGSQVAVGDELVLQLLKDRLLTEVKNVQSGS